MGRSTAIPYLMDVDDRLHQPIDPLPAQPRYTDDRHAAHLWQSLLGPRGKLADAAGALLAQIPFADRDHQRAALTLDQIGDAQILLLEWVLDVHQHHHHVGKTDGV